MARVRLIAVLAVAALASACAPTLGPPAPGAVAPPAPGQPAFHASEFAWAEAAGAGIIAGRLTYARGQARYTCHNASVILTPETPWSRRRMQVLYLSSERAALPVDQVRARSPEAPPGDSTPFLKRTICDANDRFAFSGLPDGAWYAITIAKPAEGAGPSVALMRRVMTKAGKVTNLSL